MLPLSRLAPLTPIFAFLLGCGEVVPIVKDGGTTEESDASTTPTECQSDSDCRDELRCNGEESCAPGAAGANAKGCLVGQPVCAADETCFEEGDVMCADRCQISPDLDDDGFDAVACGGTDCNDDDKLANPDGVEVCDLNHVDEDCDPATVGETDLDSDGLVAVTCCNSEAEGTLDCGVDCDDSQKNFGVGDWAHCGACGQSCDVREACGDDSCKPARRVFVTSSTHTGNLNGLSGADGICNELANKAKLGGTFRALLAGKEGGLERLERAQVPYVRLDGKLVAKNFSDLLDMTIDTSLNMDENRQLHNGLAWTGTSTKTVTPDVHCSDWTNGTSQCVPNAGGCGVTGDVRSVDEKFLEAAAANCSASHRLYCLEQ